MTEQPPSHPAKRKTPTQPLRPRLTPTTSTSPDTPPTSDSGSSNPETTANSSLPQTPVPAANTTHLLSLPAPHALPEHQCPAPYKFSSLRPASNKPAARHTLRRSTAPSPSPAPATTAQPASPTPQSHTSRYHPTAAPTQIPLPAPSPKTPPATAPPTSPDSTPPAPTTPDPDPPRQISKANTPAPVRRRRYPLPAS